MMTNTFSTEYGLIPERLLDVLMPFQKEGVQFAIRKNGRCLIADEMGLGKTLQALAVASYYREEWPLLVIVPSSLKYAWVEELEKWLPELDPRDINLISSGIDVSGIDKCNVTITTYGLLSKTSSSLLNEALMNQQFGVVIADESHYIRNVKTSSSKVASSLIASANRRILLSGTPALSRPVELYPQINAILPGHFGTWWDFTTRFCNARYEFFGKTRRRNVRGASNLAELQSLLSSTVMIRREKKHVLTQLPPKQRQKILFDLKQSPQKAELLSLFANLRGRFGPSLSASVTPTHDTSILSQIQQLYKLSCTVKIGPVTEYVRLLCDNQHLKFLVFAHHHAMMDAIQQCVHEAKVKFIRIDGATSTPDRLVGRHVQQIGKCEGAISHMVEDGDSLPCVVLCQVFKVLSCEHKKYYVHQFQSDPECRVAILSILAAGVGLTFTAASLVVFAEMHWTPGMMIQCEDRAHRIGQSNAVSVHYLVAKDTMDECVWSTINKKTAVVTVALNGKRGCLEAYHGDRYQIDLLSNADSDITLQTQSNATTQAAGNIDAFFLAHENKDQRSILDFFSKDRDDTPASQKLSTLKKQKESGSKIFSNADKYDYENAKDLIVLSSDDDDEFDKRCVKKLYRSPRDRNRKDGENRLIEAVRENVYQGQHRAMTCSNDERGQQTGHVSVDDLPVKYSVAVGKQEADGPEWSCGICTFINHPGMRSCEMCDTPKKKRQHTALKKNLGDSYQGYSEKKRKRKVRGDSAFDCERNIVKVSKVNDSVGPVGDSESWVMSSKRSPVVSVPETSVVTKDGIGLSDSYIDNQVRDLITSSESITIEHDEIVSAAMCDTVVSSDTCMKSDTIVTADTCVENDTIVSPDTCVKSDTIAIADTCVKSDTILSADVRIESDSVISADTCIGGDTILSANTFAESDVILSADTFIKRDTVVSADKCREVDTVVSSDTCIETGTVVVKKDVVFDKSVDSFVISTNATSDGDMHVVAKTCTGLESRLSSDVFIDIDSVVDKPVARNPNINDDIVKDTVSDFKPHIKHGDNSSDFKISDIVPKLANHESSIGMFNDIQPLSLTSTNDFIDREDTVSNHSSDSVAGISAQNEVIDAINTDELGRNESLAIVNYNNNSMDASLVSDNSTDSSIENISDNFVETVSNKNNKDNISDSDNVEITNNYNSSKSLSSNQSRYRGKIEDEILIYGNSSSDASNLQRVTRRQKSKDSGRLFMDKCDDVNNQMDSQSETRDGGRSKVVIAESENAIRLFSQLPSCDRKARWTCVCGWANDGDDCENCLEPQPHLNGISTSSLTETSCQEGRERHVNLDQVGLYETFLYGCSQHTGRIYLYDSDGCSLKANFLPLDIEMNNFGNLPDILLLKDNLNLVKKFVREWHMLSETKKKYLIKHAPLMSSPVEEYQRLKLRQTCSTQRTLSKQRVRVDGRPNCLNCHQPFISALLTSPTITSSSNAWLTRLCSPSCMDQHWMKTQPSYCREKLAELEHGVCQMCGIDAHTTYSQIRSTKDLQTRAQLIQDGPYKDLKTSQKIAMTKHPVEGQFWQADHILPVWEGGGLCDIDNLRTLCTMCHTNVTRIQARQRAWSRKHSQAIGSHKIFDFFSKN